MWKKLLGLVIAACLLATPAFATGGHTVQAKRNPDASLQRRAKNTIATTNWSGYTIPQYQTGLTYPSAIGTWVVPAVTYGVNSTNQTVEYMSNWVGIGGFCTTASCGSVYSDLIQLGTLEEISSTGGTFYEPWYEMLPSGSIQIPHPIQPGDVVTASITCLTNCSTPNASQTWTIAMTDTTSGWNWSLNVTYTSSLSSAEWITEAPFQGSVLPLPAYSQITYAFQSPIGTIPPLSSTGATVMEDASGGWSNVSGLSTDGSNFSTCYGAGVLVSCTSGSIALGTIGSGGGGGGTVPAPVVSISASPSTISSGTTSTVAYSSSNATACTGTNFTATGTKGSVVVTPIVTTKYTLTCTGDGGTGSGSTTVTVKTTKTKGNGGGHH